MSITAAALSQLLRTCAPNIGPRTMTAIVTVESARNPLAVRDNTLDRAFYPKTLVEAMRLANYLLGRRHNLDLGISQVNSANFPGLGLSVRDAFNPCNNLRSGASILAGDYRQAVAKFGPGQYALRRAIGAYNTGSLYAGDTYISMILSAAGIRDTVVDVARVPNLTQEGQTQSASREASQAPLMTQHAPVMQQAAILQQASAAPVRPEEAPILIHWQGQSSQRAVLASNIHMTHISLNQATLTHIPLNQATLANLVRSTPVVLPPASMPEDPQGSGSPTMAVPAEGSPIIVQPASQQIGAGGISPAEILRQAAIRQRGGHE